MPNNVPTAGDLHSYAPRPCLLHRQAEQPSGSSIDDDESSEVGSCSEEDDGEPDNSRTAGSKPEHWLSHTKSNRAAKAKVLLQLRQLSGYDLRHSLQVRLGCFC